MLRLDVWLRTRRRRDVGAAGEIAASRFLARNGLVTVARNWRGRRGELDLVAVTAQNELVIVEVKTTRERAEDAWSKIDPAKEMHLSAAALEYLASRGLDAQEPYRIDVVVVVGDPRALRGSVRFLWARGAV